MPNPQPTEVSARLALAVKIAKEAGDFTLRYFRRDDLHVEQKADKSPVTIADRGAEELLRKRIAEKFPHDAIVGEEFDSETGTSGYQWVLDPVDGTKSFIHGIPLYTTLVAVLKDDQPAVGVIHSPATSETVYAQVGGGCWHLTGAATTPSSAHVSKVRKLNEALIVTTDIPAFTTYRAKDSMDVWIKLQRAARLTRTWGDGYGYLMVATGRAEVMIDPEVKIWDMAPLRTVIQEAGGYFSDWKGNRTIHAREAIATNGLVTDEVLAITRAGGAACTL